MKLNDAKSSSAIGFLTVVENPEIGLFGGYLILNRLGRPLEFHCTAPIKPSRAQEILYGATLKPYLFGEQIGRTLVGSAKTQPLAVLTDREPALALRQFVDLPVVFVLAADDAEADSEATGVRDSAGRVSAGPSYRIDDPHPTQNHLTAFHLGRSRVAVPSWAAEDQNLVTTRLGELAPSFDFQEPFERIREAIEEARRGG